MKKLLLFMAATAAMTLAAGCTKKLVQTASYHPSATEYVRTEGDGSITLRAYGTGSTRKEALQHAHKNALHDVIFSGIAAGGDLPHTRPLLREVNAEEKYPDFFASFFRDEGAYTQFVRTEDARHKSRRWQQNPMQVKCAVTVRVLRADLRQYLIDHHILKTQTQL